MVPWVTMAGHAAWRARGQRRPLGVGRLAL
jgi:hypothetical protein